MRILVNRASQDRNRVQLLGLVLAATGIVLSAMPASAEKTLIYKSVAGDGSVEFTDQATADAVVITPSPLNIVEAPAPQAQQTIPDPAAIAPTQGNIAGDVVNAGTLAITSVNISSPVNKETLIDHEGPIWVAIQTTPATTIPAGLTAEVLVNGKRVVTGSSDRLPIEVPERGTHRVQVKIVDQKGQVTAESAMHEIHIKKRVSRNAN